MQNKGALKFLAIALAIACCVQLSFTFVTRHVEKKAAEYAAGDAVKEQNYLDSIKSQTVYNLGFVKFNYKECKEKEINLGLDLRGGMNVMLEISVEDVVRALSNDAKIPLSIRRSRRPPRLRKTVRATISRFSPRHTSGSRTEDGSAMSSIRPSCASRSLRTVRMPM